ncbi:MULTISPECIES: alcohol dehydrogenase-like regulatory protein ErcA [Methanobacterium]|uniref:Alcohol dehydrogenase n=1 Tax=Methanobacterium bryantii TaxID=2161 RepID=A0A2A2H304_METBR|nr:MULTISPECIES: alcohol dehydrogenase-like regulatory protein ErcA [Methanobacterium]OEC87650.1 alcohol dehydrogenase [Methanobacterium sp. A39]PAV03714.1 alcohol dehydrogenase [Methanobacterium bryantii]
MDIQNMELRKFVAPELVFGLDARLLAGRYAKNFGAQKVLIVSDQGVINAGWLDGILHVLETEGISYEIYRDVTPNPKEEDVIKGAELYKDEECDAVVALGGGSALDCAKGIGIVSSHNRGILEFEGVDKVYNPIPPLICIPTTAGSSADVSQFAIIRDQKRKVKISIISKAVVPDVALIDPITTTTMDNYLTACTGLDALTHAIEAYVSNASSPLTDTHALNAIRLIWSSLAKTICNPNDLGLRGNMMLGSLEAGLAFSNASLGAVHAMAHSLGGFLDLSHGECNAVLLDHVVDFNFDAEPLRYQRIGEAMGINFSRMTRLEKKTAVIHELKHLKESIGIDHTLRQIGVKESDILQLSKNAMEDSCIVTNPCRPDQEDIGEIFRNAL